MVQDRLVEAVLTCWRLPDRERAWSRGASDGPWHLVMADALDYDGGRGAAEERADVALRPAALTRREVGEMDEAFGWLDAVAPEERRLVGMALTQLARGRREVPWRSLLKPMGLRRGADGLRMRYGRALASICSTLNAKDLCGEGVVNPNNLPAR